MFEAKRSGRVSLSGQGIFGASEEYTLTSVESDLSGNNRSSQSEPDLALGIFRVEELLMSSLGLSEQSNKLCCWCNLRRTC